MAVIWRLVIFIDSLSSVPTGTLAQWQKRLR